MMPLHPKTADGANTVLFIDDDPEVLSTLTMVVGREFKTLSARSVSEGLRLLRGTPHPSAITLDLCMPQTDGLEGLRRIREIDADVPVVVLTGHSSLQSARQALRLGATDYLEKPFDSRELIHTLRILVSKHELARHPANTDPPPAPGLPDLGAMEYLHDLSNPLTIIGLQLDLLDAQLERMSRPGNGDGLDALRGPLAMANRQARRCRDLLSHWKRIVRLQGQPARSTDLARILAECVSDLSAIRQGSVSLSFLRPSVPVQVHGHAFELGRMFSNLVLNALQACPAQNGQVRISCNRTGSGVCVDITDNGPGIPPENLDHIFRPFFSTKGESGSGLGLHLAKRVAEAHGGRIEVQSRPGFGSTFSVHLPLANGA